ncbi:serine/threonine-protein kinase [Amycolatopsis thermophila]|uniref:Serine/threonine-protein kinase n=1 Tax=Amycolatopsis thermophila TaxID=206084 RepID=A0ABU0F0C9_9PSEU|nr:serine/threonine-protein kinase [Amycolatopsis thermophila]MDQ0381020.1 serine/threonine-protein kinase [Amycolatopsis thermophila]
MNQWRVPGYSEVEVLGTGGFGRVVLAKHEATGQLVAIKYLLAEFLGDPGIVANFRREALLLHGVRSPHVAQVHDFVERPEGAALVMEAVPGVSLRVLLAAEKKLAPESALAILKGSLLGLAAAHAVGVVHRDYKPGNVLVSQAGESKLVDFGLATLDGQAGLAAGSPSYMAPEQWSGLPGLPATDVYAATCVFFQCITGHKPFDAGTTEELRALHQAAPVPLGAVPEPVRPLVARGMAKDPAQRPPTADAFVAELEATARAVYGPDWESRGWKRLAAPVAALTALTPLALLATAGTAAAPVAAVASAPAGAGIAAATIGKVVVGVLVTALVAVGGFLVYQQFDDDPPRQAALSVDLTSTTGRDPALPITYDLQYPRVSGHADPAAEQRINAALRAPVDERLDSVRRALADPEAVARVRSQGETIGVRTTATIMLRTETLLSVRYDHALDSDYLSHSSWRFPEGLNVDLGSGRVLGPADIFRGDVLTASGMAALTERLVTHSARGFCHLAEVGGPGPLASIDSAETAAGGDHVPVADVVFTPAGMDFLVRYADLGCTEADGQETITLPYQEIEDLLSPSMLTMLGRPASSSSAAPSSAASSSAALDGKVYTNARFGFSLQVPEDYQRRPYAPSGGDGMEFTDSPLGATMTVWGENNTAGLSTADALAAAIRAVQAQGGQVTAQRVEGEQYTISGYTGDRIFYERGFVGRGSRATLHWDYPRVNKEELDAAVSRTVKTLEPGDLSRPH